MIKKILGTVCLCLIVITADAQLEVKEFFQDKSDPAATQFPERDDNDSICALVIVKIPLKNVEFDGNVVKVKKMKDGYWVYLTKGTRDLEVIPSSEDKLTSLPLDITNYINKGLDVATYKLIIQLPQNTVEDIKSSFTLSVGFNVMPFLGPTVSAGFMFQNFCLEAGATYGLSKSSDVYIYDKAGSLADGYSYNAFRGFLRVGYDKWFGKKVFAITPQIGAAFNAISGSRISDVNVTDKVMDGATAISGTVGARFMFAPSGRNGTLRLFVTPEYDFALSKDKNFEALSAFDSKIKSWAEGLNVNLGLLFYF